MSDQHVDFDTAEYQRRRAELALRRAQRADRQKQREKKIRRYMTIAAASAGAVVIFAVVLIIFLFATKHQKTHAKTGERPYSEIDAEAELAGEDGDVRELLYDPKGPEGAAHSGKLQTSANSAMTPLTPDEIAAIKAGQGTGYGQEVLNTTADANTGAVSQSVDSGYAILVSVSDNRVLASRQAHTLMYPASMTKVMTLLVACENIKREEQLGEIFTMTQAIEGFSYEHHCSNVGFSVGERVRVEDLMYGTILPSGADAAMGLAEYTAGDQETFVKMMNDKVAELGISGSTHFTNCIGIYDDDNYSTAADMAVIMNAAINNPLCYKVLSRHTYTTTKTSFHPDGIIVSNWFLRRIEDKQPTGEVICGKTGFVNQSLNCAVSYARDESGKGYICCTGFAHGGWKAIGDHVALYSRYFDPDSYTEPETDAGEGAAEGEAAEQEAAGD